MPYHYEWLQPSRVIFCYVYGDQDFDDAAKSVLILESMLDQGTKPTHYIVDTRHNTRLPTTNIRQFRKMMSFVRHPQLGWIVAVVRHPVTSYVFALVAKLTRVQYRAVETPDEALDFICNLDATVTITTDLNALIEQIQSQANLGK